MSRIPSIAISAGLIGSGVLAWTFATRSLVSNSDLAAPLNPLGINGSPYGEVFAMAMQAPIDNYFHAGMGQETHNHAPGESCTDHCTQEHKHDETCDHEHDENCNHDHHEHEAADASKTTAKSPSLNTQLGNLLGSLDKVREVRTNPKVASEALRRHLRREAENKLRFAYQLDPSHYGNYNSLHLFLTEPQLGTRPELTPSAAKLADDTIRYCLKQDHDPRPALTAAAAATNILELMFNDRQNPAPKYSTAQMRQYLVLLDYCMVRYVSIARQWDESKQWELLSPMRIAECSERFHFIGKIREAAEKTIIRFETESQSQQAAN
jgi:hypothetical protein